MASASLDGTWCLYDIMSGICIHQVKSVDYPRVDSYCCAAFHPSGALLGTGSSSSTVKLWDVRTEALAAVYSGHTGPVVSVSFANYAHLFATAATDGVRMWDVRVNSVQSLSLYSHSELQGSTFSVDLDEMGHYLALAGDTVKVLEVKSSTLPWRRLKSFPCTGSVVKLWHDYAAVGMRDGHLNSYGVRRV